jgi:hypothetical protein
VGGLSAIIIVAALICVDQCRHWFLPATVLAGMPLLRDLIRVARGELGLFTARALVAAVAYYGISVTPVLHVYFDYWMLYIDPPPDWRPWLGAMGCLNGAGVLLYAWVSRMPSRGRRCIPNSVWRLNLGKLQAFGPIFLLLGLVLQLWVYAASGGVAGYMTALTIPDAFQGMGWLFVLSESVPATLIVLFAFCWKRTGPAPLWTLPIWVLALFLVTVAFGGLRGSRATIVWTMLWAVAVFDIYMRRFPRSLVPVAALSMVAFMYGYGFYKALNIDVLSAIRNSATLAQVEHDTSRSMSMVLLGDLERSDVQAYTLFKSFTEPQATLANGRTYLASLALLVPRQWWSDRPVGKVFFGTELFWGYGAYSDHRYVQNIYGLAGEALMNFGPVAVPFMFMIPAYLVRRLTALEEVLPSSDPRRILLPLAGVIVMWVIVADLDNVLWITAKHAAWPFFLIWLCSRKYRTFRPRPLAATHH